MRPVAKALGLELMLGVSGLTTSVRCDGAPELAATARFAVRSARNPNQAARFQHALPFPQDLHRARTFQQRSGGVPHDQHAGARQGDQERRQRCRARGDREMTEGIAGVAVSDAAAQRSAELAAASDALAAEGAGELKAVAKAAAVAGGAEIAEGARAFGAGQTAVPTGEALAARAGR